MRRLLIAILLLLAPLPALAANTVTIAVVAENGGGQTTQTWTMSPEDMQKFQSFVQNAYGCKAAPGQECEQFTNDQMMGMWASATIQGTIDNVNRDQKVKAAEGAAGDVTPIPPQTPPPIDQPAKAKKAKTK